MVTDVFPFHGPEAPAHVPDTELPDVPGDGFDMELAHLPGFSEGLHVVVVVVLQDAPDDDGREFVKIQSGFQPVVSGTALPEIFFDFSGQ